MTFNNIQMLRAVAAAMVLFFHAAPHYDAMHGALRSFAEFASIGYSGVDIFFVISGFVAAHTTLDKPRTLPHAWAFAKRRLLRIYLGYWPFFALALALTWTYHPAELANVDLVTSFFLASTNPQHLLMYVTWSLSYELIFYALVVASFALPVRIVKVAVQVCGGAILALLIWKHDMSSWELAGILCEFFAGVIVYLHRERLRSRWWIAPLALCAAIGFGAGALLHATNGGLRVLTFGAGAVALFMLALTLEQSRTFVANRVWVALGDASYTLYLAHGFLFTIFFSWGIRDFLAAQPMLLREAGFLLYVAFCLWITWVFYVRVEGPLYRWATSSLAARRPAPQGMARSSP